MVINFQDLKSRIVETEDGTTLGTVLDLEINIHNHEITKYIVAKHKIFPFEPPLSIAPQQIIRVTEEKIIVRNTLVIEPIDAAFKKFTSHKQPTSINAKLN